MTSSRGVRRRYVGPVDAITTRLDGVVVVVERGQTVDVSREQADALDVMEGMWEPASDPADLKPRDAAPDEVGEPATATPADLD